MFIDHLHVEPQYKNEKIGKMVVDEVKAEAQEKGLPVRLGALRGSTSSDFYIKNGFVKTHEDEFDIYYEYTNN